MHLSYLSDVSVRFTRRTLCPLLMLGLSTITCASGSVFINEIHYDNDGPDLNEALEIAGPSGLNMSGWHLLMYNGNGGTVYKSFELDGTIPNLTNGFGVLSFNTSGLQNGPDGMALTDANNQVLQFLSYEKSFTASDGAASGLSSELIDVSETVGTSALESLQLTGTGRFYEDFQWSGPRTQSFGALNTGQIVASSAVPAPATLPLLIPGLVALAFLSGNRSGKRLGIAAA